MIETRPDKRLIESLAGGSCTAWGHSGTLDNDMKSTSIAEYERHTDGQNEERPYGPTKKSFLA